MSISEQLIALNDAKQDIKNALVEKGVTPTGGLSTYADAVRGITGNQYPPGTKFAYSDFTEAPYFDTSEYTDMSRMFSNCRSLTNVPLLNTTNVTNMSYMFENAHALSVVPQFDTTNVTNMSCMFRRVEYIGDGTGVPIEIIPLMDCGNVEFFEIFGSNSYGFVGVRYIEGFKDLGKSITQDYNAAASYKNVSFERAYLNRESVVNIINNLYDIASQNKTLTLQLNSYTLSFLSAEDIAIATTKGWNVTV